MNKKIWFITGVSKGMGKEIARCAISENSLVIGTVRTKRDKENLEKEMDIKVHILNLIEISTIEKVVQKVVVEYGKIDVLVNNAGYGAFGMIEEFNETEVRQQMEVNFVANWKLCQCVLPHMRKQQSGTIVQISSRMGIVSGVGNGMYAAVKFAIEAISESLKQELQPFGIHVLLVEPGAMRTDFFGQSVSYAKKEIKDYTEALLDIRSKTKAIHGKQTGNPTKAAKIIVKMVLDDIHCFRLPLTSGTITAMETKIKELQNTVEDMRILAGSIEN